ncbi:hypothetical protein AZE42_13152, partial [Rhizopogon vesiculosus]
MCTHLKNCQRQPEDVREQAYALCILRGWIKGPPGARSVSLNTPLQQVVDLPLQTLPNLRIHGVGMNHDMGSTSASQFGVPPLFLSSFPLASGSGMNSSSQASTSASNLQAPTPNYWPGSVLPQYTQSPHFSAHALYPQSDTPISNLSSASESSIALSLPLARSISTSPAPILFTDAAHILPTTTGNRVRAVSRTHSGGLNVQVSQWSNVTQERFETHLANITASCGFPSNWVENHAVWDFFNEILPSASHVSSYQLSHRIVPRKAERHRNAAIQRSRDQFATLQTDGWTGGNFCHLIAFMMTTAKREVHTVRVTDVSSERKTADHLKMLILEVIKEVDVKWKATIVAITSDASGESRAARKRLVDEFPWRLLDLRTTLDILAAQERDRGSDAKIVTGDAKSQRKAREMLELIEDPLMWHVLAKYYSMLTHIGPLALAVNFAQAAHCRLDEVLIILGYLVSRYHDLLNTTTSTDDQIGFHAIINSLEKRWSKSDQTVFLAAVILNPLYKAKPFAQ